MKYKVGEKVAIINPKPNCNLKCWKKKPHECGFYLQIGIIKNPDYRDKEIWVEEMKNKQDSCTGCSGFKEKDIKKATKKDYEKYKQKLVEEEI